MAFFCLEEVMDFEKLSRDEDVNVRWSVAENPKCPISVLKELSRDERWPVRYSVALNSNCPIEIQFLIKMEN